MLAKCLYTHANVLPPNEDATKICNERFKRGLATSGPNEDLQRVWSKGGLVTSVVQM